MKTCSKCGECKPIDEFYVHTQMADGHLGKCKTCTKRDVSLNRQLSPHAREYDRRRAKQPHRMALRARVVRAWRKRHPDRMRAQNAAARAHLQRPGSCQGCGVTTRVEKHHPDYSQPLLIEWLCKPCHAIADRIRRQNESDFSMPADHGGLL